MIDAKVSYNLGRWADLRTRLFRKLPLGPGFPRDVLDQLLEDDLKKDLAAEQMKTMQAIELIEVAALAEGFEFVDSPAGTSWRPIDED